MKKEFHDLDNSPEEIVLALLFYEMFLDWGYTKEEISIEIEDQFFLVIKDGEKYFVIRTGPPQLSVEETRRYWDILLPLWSEVPTTVEAKVMLRESFNISTHRRKVAALLEQQGMFRHRVVTINASTSIN